MVVTDVVRVTCCVRRHPAALTSGSVQAGTPVVRPRRSEHRQPHPLRRAA